jgi:hypothetical protein
MRLLRNEQRFALLVELRDLFANFHVFQGGYEEVDAGAETKEKREKRIKAFVEAARKFAEARAKGDGAKAKELLRSGALRLAGDAFGAQGVVLMNALNGAIQAADRSLQKPVSLPQTAEMQALDAERVSRYRHLKAAHKVSLTDPSPTKREAARRNLILFGTYGDITRTKITDRTGKITNLIADLLDSGKGQADTNALGLTTTVNGLATVNNQYIAKEEERAGEATWSIGAPLPVKEALANADEALINLCNHATGVIESSSNRTKFEVFIQTVNNLIHSYNLAVSGKNRIDIAEAIVGSIAVQVFTGKPVTPLPSVTRNGESLYLGVHYIVKYRNNVKPGNGELILQGIGRFKGRKTVTFVILKAG